MTLGIRKTIVLVLVAAVFLLANMWLVMNWLQDKGVIDMAKHVRTEYLTGTAITILVALLILLVKPAREAAAKDDDALSSNDESREGNVAERPDE